MYSNEEIKQMSIVGFSNEFVAYLKKSSESVREIVEKMLPNEQSVIDLREACLEQEMIELDCDKEKTISDEEKKDCDSFNLNENDAIYNANPYDDLDFSKRLELEQLTVTLTDSEICSIHNCRFERVQVVMLRDGGKRYGCYLYSCLKCKRFFMKETDFKELEINLRNRNIKYTVTCNGGEK